MNQFLSGHGVQLSEETLDKLYQFADLVVDTKEYGNLISARDSEKFLSRHIADSLVPFVFMGKSLDPSTSPNGSAQDDKLRWADMGAGAKLHLDNLTVVGKRFETSGLTDLDFISCRALSTFENDWERAQAGLKRGGTFVTLKSFNNIAHSMNFQKKNRCTL